MIKKHIPNFITSLNLFSGCFAIYYGFQANYEMVMLFILTAAVFDFLDGMAARILKAYSPLGKELDSLADAVSFGVAPGVLVFSLINESALPHWMAFTGFIVPVFSALRLAKFNIDERQTNSFIGMPTPANALFWAGMAYSFSDLLIDNGILTIIIAIVFCFFMVSEVPMFSLKFKNLSLKNNWVQYLFLAGCIALIVYFQTKSLALIIAWYLVLSAIMAALSKKTKSEPLI